MTELKWKYIDHDNDVYSLDYIKIDEKTKIPALTEHNSKFLEAVIRLDSRYRYEQAVNDCSPAVWECLGEKDKFESYKINAENSNKPIFSTKPHQANYIGSLSFWFNKLNNPGQNQTSDEYKKCIWGILLNINLSNSTRHSYNEILSTIERLLGEYPTFNDLKEALNTDIIDNNHILYLLTNKSNTNEDSFKLSLASKFCSYAGDYLKLNKTYSKYDMVVSQNLWYYNEFYLNNSNINSNSFNIHQNSKSIDQIIVIYNNYTKCINNLLTEINNCLKFQSFEFDKNKLDHIIWYINK